MQTRTARPEAPTTLLKSPHQSTETTPMRAVRFLAACVALALSAAACTGTSPSESSTSTTSISRPATTSTAGSTDQVGDDEIDRRIDELIIEAQQIRDLEFLEPVNVILLSDADYQARFSTIIEEELAEEDVAAINALLRVLGIIGPTDDYRQLIDTLLSSGTGGFYDPETGELVVRLVGDEFGVYAESVVIHELVHALQDQHFPLLDNEDLEGDDSYVASAIIEGDALLREITYVQSLSVRDQAAYFAEVSEIDLSALDSLPFYITESFQAAYLDGFFFHQEIGLDEIDHQFTDLPESSEQLLKADSYVRDEQPVAVELPEFELAGYEVWFDATAGQKDIELLLTDAVGPGGAADAASGWGGDANRIYNKGDEAAVYVLSYVGDTIRDAEELQTAFEEFIDQSVVSDAYTLVERDGPAVLVIIATDPALGPQLETAFS